MNKIIFSDWKFQKITRSEKIVGYHPERKFIKHQLKNKNNYIFIFYLTHRARYYIGFHGSSELKPMYRLYNEFVKANVIDHEYSSLEEAKEKIDWFISKYNKLKTFI